MFGGLGAPKADYSRTCSVLVLCRAMDVSIRVITWRSPVLSGGDGFNRIKEHRPFRVLPDNIAQSSRLSPSCLEAIGECVVSDEPTQAASSRNYKFQTAMCSGLVMCSGHS